MTQTVATPNVIPVTKKGGRGKFLVGGALILAAILYLIVTATQSTAQYYYTVQELKDRGASEVGKNVRISGAVVGESVQYNAETLELRFTVANMPGDQEQIDALGGLAAVLKSAVSDPTTARLNVIYAGVKPDLMKGEAQAIMDGRLDENGLFHADTLLMKCPTRYEGAPPTVSK